MTMAHPSQLLSIAQAGKIQHPRSYFILNTLKNTQVLPLQDNHYLLAYIIQSFSLNNSMSVSIYVNDVLYYYYYLLKRAEQSTNVPPFLKSFKDLFYSNSSENWDRWNVNYLISRTSSTDRVAIDSNGLP